MTIQLVWKMLVKYTWEYFNIHFEAALRQLQKNRENTVRGTSYHQSNLIQA